MVQGPHSQDCAKPCAEELVDCTSITSLMSRLIPKGGNHSHWVSQGAPPIRTVDMSLTYLLPCGTSAYDPRAFMSPVHCAPIDSVRVFQDIKARKAIGAHWVSSRVQVRAPFGDLTRILHLELRVHGV